jgi:nucleotide-binding universal stress UspA family protein
MSTPATFPVQRAQAPARLRNILFATDFSEASMKALPYVGSIARTFGAKVFQCHVITPTPIAIGAAPAAQYVFDAEYENANRVFANAELWKDLNGLEKKSLLPSGIFADALAETIAENEIDLVVAGTHGRTGLSRLLLGSTVEQICRVASCPVLTVGPHLEPDGKKIEQILMLTDLSDESRAALPYVVEFAQRYGASVTVLHVLPEETATNPDAKALSEPIRRTVVHSFEESFKGLKVQYVLESGDIVPTILSVAERQRADLIALGVRSAFLPGFQLRSSVAYRVISGAHCPVLTCRLKS